MIFIDKQQNNSMLFFSNQLRVSVFATSSSCGLGLAIAMTSLLDSLYDELRSSAPHGPQPFHCPRCGTHPNHPWHNLVGGSDLDKCTTKHLCQGDHSVTVRSGQTSGLQQTFQNNIMVRTKREWVDIETSVFAQWWTSANKSDATRFFDQVGDALDNGSLQVCHYSSRSGLNRVFGLRCPCGQTLLMDHFKNMSPLVEKKLQIIFMMWMGFNPEAALETHSDQS